MSPVKKASLEELRAWATHDLDDELWDGLVEVEAGALAALVDIAEISIEIEALEQAHSEYSAHHLTHGKSLAEAWEEHGPALREARQRRRDAIERLLQAVEA